MNKKLSIIALIMVFLITGIILHKFQKTAIKKEIISQEKNNDFESQEQTIPKQPEPKDPPKSKPEIKNYVPQFVNYPPKNNITQGKCNIWTNVMNHAASGENFSDNDPCTEVHETLHGICKRESLRYGFYCFDSKLSWVNNPKTTLSMVAKNVPSSLRGKTYDLYLRQQQVYFNSEPIYIFDEWVAYAGGTACAIDMTKNKGWKQQRWDTVLFMKEFDVYALTLAYTVQPNDEQFKNFLGWHLEKTNNLYQEARQHQNLTYRLQEEYTEKLKTSEDAEQLREFVRQYLGKEWTKRILEF
jgi:hypothetical protein